jgi:hypothetical protein
MASIGSAPHSIRTFATSTRTRSPCRRFGGFASKGSTKVAEAQTRHVGQTLRRQIFNEMFKVR